MAAFLTIKSEYKCAHGGTVNFTTSNGRTKTGKAAILLESDAPYVVTLCPNKGNPPPCKDASFENPAAKSSITGSAPLTEASVGTSSDGTTKYPLVFKSNSSAASGT